MIDNKNYYPTPNALIDKMLDKIDTRLIKYILEPSAGKGNIIDYYKEHYNSHNHRYMGYDRKVEDYITFDAIELDQHLSNLLKGKSINVVWDNFLDFEPQRFYDLIIMNPPFDKGSEHLLKAIKIQERIGGQILCILNAKTIKNTYSNNRKELKNLLEHYNADIEYINNAFLEAERKTDVEVALIYMSIPMRSNETMFEREFKRDNPNIEFKDFQSVVVNKSKLENLIFECSMIKNSGIELFKEKLRIDKLLEGMSLTSQIAICDNTYSPKALTINKFINKINLEYWNKFINETDFKKRLPSKLRNNFTYNIEKQKDIAFNLENVRYFYKELIRSIPQSYEETVANVFDDITSRHYYSDREWEKNIYGYSGWKSNNGMKINKKCIIRCYNDGFMYRLPDILLDLNIIFENISGEKDDLYKNNNEIINMVKQYEKKIETKFSL